jgi:hypothetical protein
VTGALSKPQFLRCPMKRRGSAFYTAAGAKQRYLTKNWPMTRFWKVQTERVTLVVEPGRRNLVSGYTEFCGVPYGSQARFILLHLQSEALRTNSRDIELGRSLHAWLGRLGIPIGGKSFADVRQQADRLSRCRLTFHAQQGGRAGLINQNIVDTAMFVSDGESGQGSLFVETARLSETFYERLVSGGPKPRLNGASWSARIADGLAACGPRCRPSLR